MKFKALSFRQPWADLVLHGQKCLDLRTWSTRYRGPLAIYASQTVETERCQAFGLDPQTLTTGAVIGLVDLTGVVELDEAGYAARAGEHLGGRHFQHPLFGWELSNPRPLAQPVLAKGRLNLFDVELPAPGSTADEQRIPAPVMPAPSSPLPASRSADGPATFELRPVPQAGARPGQPSYRLAVFQRRLDPQAASPDIYDRSPELMERVVELGGVPLRAVADQVLEALRANGYPATDLGPARREPFILQEEWGVRLGLLFLAVKPVSKVARIEAISAGLRLMTSEELYYWYSKCTSRSIADRAQKALRLLLAEE